jgi:hypothetical protein
VSGDFERVVVEAGVPDYAYDTAFNLLSSLFHALACSWQCGTTFARISRVLDAGLTQFKSTPRTYPPSTPRQHTSPPDLQVTALPPREPAACPKSGGSRSRLAAAALTFEYPDAVLSYPSEPVVDSASASSRAAKAAGECSR